MNKKWREFERLVARIEKLLSPFGATVKSPDRITDKVTGQVREVDASIRYVVGSVPIFITIECRDRKAIPDDTWIEQLATKKQKIGASHTIAVSSTDFTKPAIESAKHYGIELRKIKLITDADILSWTSRIKFTNHINKASLEELRIKVYDPDPDMPLHPLVIEAIKRDKFKAKIFFSEGDNEYISIADIISFVVRTSNASRGLGQKGPAPDKVTLRPGEAFSIELKPEFSHFFDDIPENGPAVEKIIGVGLREGGLRIETVKGFKYVRRIEIVMVLARVVEEIPVTRTVRYSTSEETVTDVVEANIELFQYDQKEGFIISYKVPKEANAPVDFIVSSNDEESQTE